MNKHSDIRSTTEKGWYVMVHHSPQWIEVMLHREARGELLPREQQGTPLEPFDFFIPFQFMRPDTADDVRALFHQFVFLRASHERLRQILSADWNTRSRLHLYHYRDKEGQPIIIADSELQQLKSVLMNRQLKVFFGLPVEPIGQMAVGDRVTLLIDEWKGRQGKIERVRFHADRVSMRVAVNILGQTRSVNFDDLHEGDVIFADHDTEQLLTGNLVRNVEEQVVQLLGRHCRKGSAEQRRHDLPRLNRLLSYGAVDIEREDDRRRFTSLMLICASLLDERLLIDRYQSRLEQWLGADFLKSLAARPAVPHSALEAYMLVALFVATRQPQYRNAAKAYRKQHPDALPILGTLVNHVRNLPTVTPQ